MRWESVFQSGPDPALIVEDDRVVAANHAAGALFGVPPARLVGRSLGELAGAGSPELSFGSMAGEGPGEPRRFPLRLRIEGGREADVELSATVLTGTPRRILVNVRPPAGGEPAGAGRAAEVAEDLPVGFFRAASDGTLIAANRALTELLGLDPATAAAPATVEEIGIARPQFDHLAAVSRIESSATGDVRVVRKDGHAIWASVHVRPARDVSGVVRAYDGVMIDASERKRSEEETQARERHYRTLVNNFPEGAVVLFDGDLRLTVAESAALTEAGFPRESLEGKELAALLPAQTFALVEPNLLGALAGHDSAMEVPFGGRVYSLSVRAIRGSGGEPTGGMAVVQDITVRKHLEDKLRYLSAHDPLTGLFNRLYFEEEMARLAKGRHFPMSIVVADVDGLKAVNDRLGHAVGDELLRRAAEVLRISFRPGDVVARIGGDEFAVLLPGASEHAGESAMLRVRQHEDAQGGPPDHPPLHFSLGLATAAEGESLGETLRLADSRMYRDKMSRAARA